MSLQGHEPSDSAPQLSQSLPSDSLLLGVSESPKSSPAWSLKEFAKSVKNHFSPKAQQRELSTLCNQDENMPPSGDGEDLSSSPVSILPSLKQVDTITESSRPHLMFSTEPPSVASDTESTDLSVTRRHASGNRSKHVLNKVQSTRAFVLDIIKKVAKEALVTAHGVVKLLDGVLPSELDGVTKLLLNIWEAIDKVKANKEECLTLARRCATILNALYEDMERELTPAARDQLQIPRDRLDYAFAKVFGVARKLSEHAWLERWGHNEEILSEIDDCHQALDDCLHNFSRAILLCIYNYVHEMRTPGSSTKPLPRDAQEEADMSSSLNSLLSPVDIKSHSFSLDPSPGVQSLSAEDLREAILRLQAEQNRRDRERDVQELKRRTRRASRSKSMSVAESELSRRSHPKAESYPREASVPFSDILLMHVVGHGPVSRVYKAIWKGEVVAVKIYARIGPTGAQTARKSQDFIKNEIEIWQKLEHPNVLELRNMGVAPGATEGMRVEFVISPFLPHGSVSSYLRQMQWNYHGIPGRPERLDERRMFFDVAKGMEYLHSQRILHGNLKASNVLIDSHLNCLISDFKYSEDLRNQRNDNGTVYYGLRWQAPEVLRGKSALRESVDIYAYAVFCTEVINSGEIPWPYWSDEDIRRGILEGNLRPDFSRDNASELGILPVIEDCWDSSPDLRPHFRRIVKTLKKLYSDIS